MENRILNLTQHPATAEQREVGVIDFANARDVHAQRLSMSGEGPAASAFLSRTPEDLREILTFDALPDWLELTNRARHLARMAREMGYSRAMIGGAPFFMAPLQHQLLIHGILPVYAFSVRETKEERLPDGTIRKTSVFRHEGFVYPA